MKRSNKKLQFKTQTVRSLVADDLGQVVGGATTLDLSTSAGPARCTTTWSGCSNHSQACNGPIQPPTGGGGFTRFTC